jgi:hypothetical protein
MFKHVDLGHIRTNNREDFLIRRAISIGLDLILMIWE